MLADLLDDLKAKVDGALKLAAAGSIAAAAALAAFTCFAVALFLWTDRHYGELEAWMVLGFLFLLVFATGGGITLYVRKPRPKRMSQPKPVVSSRLLQDPAVILAGLQIVRMIGVRGLLPLLVIGAVAGGLFAGRNGDRHARNPDRPETHMPESG